MALFVITKTTYAITNEGESESQTNSQNEKDGSLMKNKVMDIADHVQHIHESNAKLE